MSLKFKFSENNEVLEEFVVNAAPLQDFTQYRTTLKSLQKSVNEYLTTLVSKDCEGSAPLEAEKEEDLSDTDSEEEKNFKRTLSNDSAQPRKAKVKKSQ